MILIEESNYNEIVKALLKLRTIQNYTILTKDIVTDDERGRLYDAENMANVELQDIIETVLLEEYPDDDMLQCLPDYRRIREENVDLPF